MCMMRRATIAKMPEENSLSRATELKEDTRFESDKVNRAIN